MCKLDKARIYGARYDMLEFGEKCRCDSLCDSVIWPRDRGDVCRVRYARWKKRKRRRRSRRFHPIDNEVSSSRECILSPQNQSWKLKRAMRLYCCIFPCYFLCTHHRSQSTCSVRSGADSLLQQLVYVVSSCGALNSQIYNPRDVKQKKNKLT